jgi:hypothetical protein
LGSLGNTNSDITAHVRKESIFSEYIARYVDEYKKLHKQLIDLEHEYTLFMINNGIDYNDRTIDEDDYEIIHNMNPMEHNNTENVAYINVSKLAENTLKNYNHSQNTNPFLFPALTDTTRFENEPSSH